jgi:hypothetical protein
LQTIVFLASVAKFTAGTICAFLCMALKGASMDEFSLIVLEDTLELATEGLPSELVSDCVGNIRECVGAVSADPSDVFSTRKLRIALKRLTDIAHQNNKFLVKARLQSIARQFDVSDVA